jgi:hypothetical protein
LTAPQGGTHDQIVTAATAPHHHWPEESETPPRARKRGLLGRIGRIIGDTSLTIGMREAFIGGPNADREAIYNVMLFGEGDAKGREATDRRTDH